MRISYTEHVSNDEVLRRVGQERKLLGQVKVRSFESQDERHTAGQAYHQTGRL